MDDVIDLQHSIEPRYRENAVFLMSDEAVRELRKYRTVGFRNVWQGDMQNDTPVKLLGVPVITCRPMPKVESGSIPIGDRDPRSVKRLNELYALQGVVGYTVSERVDAVLLDKRAIVGLKVK